MDCKQLAVSENLSQNWLTRFFKLSVINILSSMILPISGLVDTAFLGHLQDISYLAGVAIASTIFGFIYGTCSFLRMGTTGSTAQAEGSEDRIEVFQILLRSLSIALILGLLLILLQYPLQNLGFSLLHASPEVKMAGKDYFSARILGAPAVLLNLSAIGWLVGRGKSIQVLILYAIGCISNIILDYFFVVHFHWASTGVGAATAISEYLMFLTVFVWMLSEYFLHQLWSKTNQVFDRKKMIKMLQLNGDLTLRSIATRLTIVIFVYLGASLGTEVAAINSLLFQIIIIVTFLTDGLSYATETLAGYFQGQKATQQLYPLLKISGSASVCLGLVAVSPFILSPHMLFGLLTDRLEILDKMGIYLFWLLPFVASSSVFCILRGYWLGLMESKILLNSTIAGLVSFIPVAAIAMYCHSNQMLWLALCVFPTIAALIMSIPILVSRT